MSRFQNKNDCPRTLLRSLDAERTKRVAERTLLLPEQGAAGSSLVVLASVDMEWPSKGSLFLFVLLYISEALQLQSKAALHPKT